MSIALNILRPRPSPIQPFSWSYFSSFGPRTNRFSQLELARDRLGSYLTKVFRRLRFFYKLDFLLSRFRFIFRSDTFVQLHLVFYSTRINTNAPILIRRRLRWSQISNAQRRFILTLRRRKVFRLLNRALPHRRFSIRRLLKTLRNWFFFPRLRIRRIHTKKTQKPRRGKSRSRSLPRSLPSIRMRRIFFILPFLDIAKPHHRSTLKFFKLFPIPVILPALSSRKKIRAISKKPVSLLGRMASPRLLEFLLPFRFQRLLHRRSRKLRGTGSFSFFDPLLPIVSFFSRRPVRPKMKLRTRLSDPNSFLVLFGIFYARLFRRQPLVFKLLALRGHYSVLKGLQRFNTRFSAIFSSLRRIDLTYRYEYGMESLNSRLLLEYIYVRLRLRYRLSQVVSRRFLYRLNSYFYGVYFLAKGRFERRQRALYRRFYIGLFSPNTHLYNLDVFFRPIVTKHGRGGLRLALNSPRPPAHLFLN